MAADHSEPSEDALRERLASLDDFFDHGVVGLHLVAGDGTILRANRAELEMLGYTFDEYVGRKIQDFHCDPEVIEDILARLTRGERLQSYSARLRCKDGSVRHVLISSNALFRDAGLINTRCFTVDVTDRFEVEQDLHRSRSFLRNILDSTEEAFYAVDREGVTTLCNRAFVEMLGFENESQAIGRKLHDVIHHSHPDGRPYPKSECPVYHAASAGQPAHVEGEVFFRQDGSSFPVEYRANPLYEKGELQGAICTFFDISERRAAEAALREQGNALAQLNTTLEERVAAEVAERGIAEEALRQAQKMEAVGQLTGGVAHDFNNLLTVIIGGLDSILRTKPAERIERSATMALQAADRATSLTTRLLAFSRRQPLQPRPSDLNILVRDMTELLHRTLGETIELEGALAPRLWTVDVDPPQLESAILNLALNARDAMPEGGRLTLESANTVLDEGYAATDKEVIPGQYVMIAVSDTGSGMEESTLAKVFEPFFTTKDVGKGTGLGLSMVYGFVKQSGGHVTVYSEPGHGTTVKLYFPRYFGDASVAGSAENALVPKGDGEEVILVVEDNEDVRTYSVGILQELGYSVLEAADADAALAILRDVSRLDLLFTDVVLPGKSGRVLADAAQVMRPDLPVLFTTGYSRNAIVHHGRLDAGVQLIGKPFTFEQLASRVRDLLDAKPA